MGNNNINVQEAMKFMDEVKAKPEAAKKAKKVAGEWAFDETKPQFRATLEFKAGKKVIEADLAPFMGGHGLSPDPIQYCLYGLAACYAGTFMTVATMEGVEISELKVVAENRIDLSKALGLSERPLVERVELTVAAKSDAPKQKLDEIRKLAMERCPGVYCVSNPIPISSKLT